MTMFELNNIISPSKCKLFIKQPYEQIMSWLSGWNQSIDKFDRPYESATQHMLFREQQRLVFASLIIATFFASKTFNFFELKVANYSLWPVLAISMGAAFGYILLTAANLKYFDHRWFGNVIYSSETFRMTLFDSSVDIYATYFLFGSINILAKFIDNKISWVGYSIAFVFSAFILIFLLISLSKLNIIHDKNRGYVKQLKTSAKLKKKN